MAVINCKICGVMFNDRGNSGLCSYCKEQSDAEYKKVRDYIWNNPGVGIDEVVKACDVNKNQIMEWVMEERLEFSAGADSGVTCRSCGRILRSGRFCSDCTEKIRTRFDLPVGNSMTNYQQTNLRETGKMRFTGRNNRRG